MSVRSASAFILASVVTLSAHAADLAQVRKELGEITARYRKGVIIESEWIKPTHAPGKRERGYERIFIKGKRVRVNEVFYDGPGQPPGPQALVSNWDGKLSQRVNVLLRGGKTDPDSILNQIGSRKALDVRGYEEKQAPYSMTLQAIGCLGSLWKIDRVKDSPSLAIMAGHPDRTVQAQLNRYEVTQVSYVPNEKFIRAYEDFPTSESSVLKLFRVTSVPGASGTPTFSVIGRRKDDGPNLDHTVKIRRIKFVDIPDEQFELTFADGSLLNTPENPNDIVMIKDGKRVMNYRPPRPSLPGVNGLPDLGIAAGAAGLFIGIFWLWKRKRK